jgi:hypothetical protein
MKHFLTYFLCFCSLLLSTQLRAQSATSSIPAHFVWTDDTEANRLQVAYFRRSFHLDNEATTAEIHLFADSRYHLLVNGHFVGFGPARFYPEHPEYDTHDLLPYLQKGENVIAVKVWSNGTSTFQLRRNAAGFIAWGDMETNNGKVNLQTPGKWRTYRVKGYDTKAARMSFALGPMEVYDARLDQTVCGWEYAGYDDVEWNKPISISPEGRWGELQPRSIPPLTNQKIVPRQLLGIYEWKQQEKIYSFQRLKADQSRKELTTNTPFVGYTYIYSPRVQSVSVGIWWGEHFLNGEAIEHINTDQPHRQQATLDLKAGWNYFYARRKSFFGKWAFQLAVPKAADLIFSPNKKENDLSFFQVASLPQLDMKTIRQWSTSDVPKSPVLKWTAIFHETKGNPAINMAWQYLGTPIPFLPEQTQDINIAHQQGTALVYDFRYKRLGRIAIEYDAPEGTIIDIGFSEDLKNGQANVMKRPGLYMATRHICAGGKGRFETFKPYGLRYLQVNISENNAPVNIKEVAVYQHIYPFEQTGTFSCSDPVMNDIWELGWRTLEVCAEDSYTDTPFRERGLYAGDMLPQMGITLAGSGDLRLIKRSLTLFQDMYIDLFQPGKMRHPDEGSLLEDYPLLTLEALRWYADRTQDWDFVEQLLPAYDQLLQGYLSQRQKNGLIHNKRVFIEWTQLEKREVYNTAFHGILNRSCVLLARLFDQIGNQEKNMYYLTQSADLRKAINQHFWNGKTQLYADGIKEEKLIDHAYPISNIWPFIAGATDSLQEETIFPYVLKELEDIGNESRKRKATPYGSFYLLAALYDQGYVQEAEQYVRKHWSPMVYKHNDTAWENFDDTGIGTLSHAWSGAPTYYLTTEVLGVDLGWLHPASPGEVIIAPQAVAIDWAKGKVPHPKGTIDVAWEVRGNHLWVECSVPEGVKWSVRPKGRLGELDLWVNGRKVTSAM